MSEFSLTVHDRVMVTHCRQVFPPGPVSAGAGAPAVAGVRAEEGAPAEGGAGDAGDGVPAEAGTPAVLDAIPRESHVAPVRQERPL